MKNLMSNFSGFAMSRVEMKKVNGGCMPPHWDVRVDGVHTACMLNKADAVRLAHSYRENEYASWTYNPGDC